MPRIPPKKMKISTGNNRNPTHGLVLVRGSSWLENVIKSYTPKGVGRCNFLFGKAGWQVRTVSFRGLVSPIENWWVSSFVLLVCFRGVFLDLPFRSGFFCLHGCQALTTISMRLVQILGWWRDENGWFMLIPHVLQGRGVEKNTEKNYRDRVFLAPKKWWGFPSLVCFQLQNVTFRGRGHVCIISHSLGWWNRFVQKEECTHVNLTWISDLAHFSSI